MDGLPYVYVVYYLDPQDDVFNIEHDFGMMVCSTFERAFLVAKQHGVKRYEVIKPGMWRAGNYWIERKAIIDSDGIGLEYGLKGEVRIPLKPPAST